MREHSLALLRAQTIPALTRCVTASAADGRSRSNPYSSSRSSGVTDMSIEATVQVLNVLRHLATAAECDGSLRHELMGSLSSSGLLEHMVTAAAPRAAAATASTAAATRAASLSTAAAAPTARPSGFRVKGGGGSRYADDGVISLLLQAVLGIISHLGHRPAPPPSLRAVLSGPCLQYFAAAQAVSQLHAADGGPLYGLPYDAVMPCLPAVPGMEGSPVSSMPVARAVGFWQACLAHKPPVRLDPLKPRHLVALCVRAARVALDSLDMHQEQQGQQRCKGPRGKGDGPAGCGWGRGFGAHLRRRGASP